MYNLYTNSIISLRSRACFSFSLNDPPSYSHSYNGGYPSSFPSCSCCSCYCNCCSSISSLTSCRVVPINPSFPFIQWPSPRRRLILSGGDRCGYDDVGRKSKGKGIALLGCRRRRVLEERCVYRRISSACEDAEAMISLLTEQVGEEFLGARERRRETASSSKSKLIRKGNELESVEVEHRKKGCRRRGEREDRVTDEYSKQGSSASSYYSCSDSGDYESVSEAAHQEFAQEGVMGSEMETRKRFGGRTSEQAKNSSDRHKNEQDRYVESVGKDDIEHLTTASSGPVEEKSTSSSKKLNHRVREEDVVSSCAFCTTCGHATSGNQTRSDSDQRSKISQVQENNVRFVNADKRSSLLQKSGNEVNEQLLQERHFASGQIDFEYIDTRQQSETRINRQEESSALLQTSLERMNEDNHQENLIATSQTDLMRKSQKHSNILDAGASYVQNTSRTQQQEEAQLKVSEENSSFISPQHAKGEHYQTVAQISSQNHSRNASKDVSSGSQVHIPETMTGSSRNASRKQTSLTERIQSAEERIKMREQVNERVKQTDLRYELHRSCRAASFYEKETSNPYVTSTSQIRIEEIGDYKEVKRNLLSGPSPKLPPPPQSIERDHVYVESAIRFAGQYSPEATGASPGGQASGTYKEPSHLVSHVDLLDSAEQMDKSSLQVIDAFVENARNEASTSVIHMEKEMSGRQLVNEGVTHTHEESTQPGGKNRELRKQSLVDSSGFSTTKGPTEEMWSLQEPPQGGVSESAATPVNVVDGRSGRTLWNALADIVQFRWGQPAESHKSPVKSGGRSSSSDYPSSEAWFSGNDLDEAQGSDMELKISSTPQELTFVDQPLLIRTPTQSSREGLTLLNTGYDARLAVDSAPSSSSGGISAEANLEVNVDERTSQVTTSMEWSKPAAGLFRGSHRRSLATLELRKGCKEAIASGRVDKIKDDLDSTPTEVSGSEEHEVELKQGKLLRNKQVMRETFNEWEEAYRLETELRKIDEVFMQEALEEARKAADRWEVPVGAVLVRDGKIIARGYNLVEDLRDCTAHAEIICIREASKILQTWRLSETTLYVTLEPCAMCAGAILQARTGTLVYGAPNKLLGADGSWIRLFPSSSVDREGGSESMVKPEGPVHPFHPKMTIRRGILEAECADVMQQFFRLRRKKDQKTEQVDERQSSKKLLLQPSKLLQKMHHVFQLLFCLGHR